MADGLSEELKIRLIEFVHQKDYLWKNDSKLYRDRNRRQLAYEEFCTTFQLGYSGTECEKVWRNLRRTYNEYRDKLKVHRKSGSAAVAIREWRFYKHMRFLDGTGQKRTTASNMPPAIIGETSAPGIAQTAPATTGEDQLALSNSSITGSTLRIENPGAVTASPAGNCRSTTSSSPCKCGCLGN